MMADTNLQQLQLQVRDLEERMQRIERRLVEAPPPSLVEIQAMIQTLVRQMDEFRTSIREEMQVQREWMSSELATLREWMKSLDERMRSLEEKTDRRFQQFEEKTDRRFQQFEEKTDRRFQQLEALIERRFRWTVGFIITGFIALTSLLIINIMMIIFQVKGG